MTPRTRLIAAAAAATLTVGLIGPASPATATDDAPEAPASDASAGTRAAEPAEPAAFLSQKVTPTKKKVTPYAFSGNGYGTSVSGGMIPVGSDRTGLARVSCTSEAGQVNQNFVAEANLPGVGTVRGVSSKVFSGKKGGQFQTVARHKVADIVLADTPLGSLSISGVNSVAKAIKDKDGYRAFANTTLAGITFTPPVGDPITLDLPTPGQPIEIPGLARITLGRTIEKSDNREARAYAVGLVIDVFPTETTVKVARAKAEIEKGFRTGIFHGSAFPAKASVLGDIVRVGRVINRVMPCIGTDGELQTEDAADVNIGDQIVVGAASAKQLGKQNKKRAVGREVSEVATVDLGGGALTIEAIKSRVNVKRFKSGKLKRSASTRILGISAGGESIPLDALEDGFEIPGLLALQTNVKRKISGGMKVIGLRITLLDGTGAVVDLATSKLAIDRK